MNSINNASTIMELLHAVGKLAVEEGETWRLEHAELMDAYQACCEEAPKDKGR